MVDVELFDYGLDDLAFSLFWLGHLAAALLARRFAVHHRGTAVALSTLLIVGPGAWTVGALGGFELTLDRVAQ